MANKRNTFVKPHALKLEVCNLITPWLFSNPKLTVAQYGVAGLQMHLKSGFSRSSKDPNSCIIMRTEELKQESNLKRKHCYFLQHINIIYSLDPHGFLLKYR